MVHWSTRPAGTVAAGDRTRRSVRMSPSLQTTPFVFKLVHAQLSHIRRDGMESTPKACTKRRADDALGHGRGRPYRGSTLAAKDSPAASLWDSGGLLLLLQSSRRVPRPAHEPCRSKPMGSYNTRLTACGRRVPSIVNVSCRCGGRRTLPLHPPAPPKSECRRRSIANRLAADLHRPVDPRAIYAA